MYLRALEIQGFKSFPEKTRLTFEKEITAIVGPNGSGKSNISDAILWVMGEQSSKTLRGGKMQDVIFGGTAKRGAMGFAQVSLIIDNSAGILGIDSEEVTITRRYYRSGESEYYINREQVRLRDVNELLMDTGLGRDGYSIIGQGRIAEIVNGKSAERREVLEEAAGIVAAGPGLTGEQVIRRIKWNVPHGRWEDISFVQRWCILMEGLVILDHLVDRGRIRREVGEDGLRRYF